MLMQVDDNALEKLQREREKFIAAELARGCSRTK